MDILMLWLQPVCVNQSNAKTSLLKAFDRSYKGRLRGSKTRIEARQKITAGHI
jgi:hypothetical protein